jgi:hypothetical protein
LAVRLYGGLYATVADDAVFASPELQSLRAGNTLTVAIEHLDVWEPTLVVRPANTV